MQIKLRYSSESVIAKTNPLIRQLFVDTMVNTVSRLSMACGILSKPEVVVLECDLLATERDFKVSLSSMPRYSAKSVGQISRELSSMLEREFNVCYNAITKMETLLDMYGGTDPEKIYHATCFDQMDV